jgi:hypothetical protein
MSRVEREAQTPEKEKKKAVRIAGNMDVGDILSKVLLRGLIVFHFDVYFEGVGQGFRYKETSSKVWNTRRAN